MEYSSSFLVDIVANPCFVKSVREETFWQIFLIEFLTLSYMKSNYIILPAPEFCDAHTYALSATNLLRKAYEQDPTLIPHTVDEMLQKYEWSVLVILDNQIIWQASIYKSTIPKYSPSYEIGSVIIQKNHGNNSLWFQVVERLVHEKWRHYHGIISATVNQKMYPIFEKNWFLQVEFPPEYLAEGEQYLAPKMVGGKEEFYQKARCYYREWPRSHFDMRWGFL